jgi:hypothetical protein
MTNYAKKNLKSGKAEGINISFDVNYIYDPNKSEKDLKKDKGENLLTFVSKEGRSHVNSRTVKKGNLVDEYTGNTGEITNSGKRSQSILHETLHFMGLSDRYDEYQNPLTGPLGYFTTHKGFEKDIMGTPWNTYQVDSYHYLSYKRAFYIGARFWHVDKIVEDQFIDVNKYGKLMTPYEQGGYHQKDY